MDKYAGFWKRFLALIIDAIILGVINWIILTPILVALGITASGGFPFDFSDPESIDPAAIVGALAAMFGVAWFVKTVVSILYHSLMEASKFQGSIGKMALGIIVTDMDGGKLDLTKALIRNVCKFVSDFTMFIGYIIAGFTAKKQALHDIIAGTLVVNK